MKIIQVQLYMKRLVIRGCQQPYRKPLNSFIRTLVLDQIVCKWNYEAQYVNSM